MPPTHVLAFRDAFAARRFVERLIDIAKLNHLAIFIQEEHVIVLDGGDRNRHREIVALARESGAMRI